MTLLAPLGLLGLLGIAVLILIYIIKPNYQQKMVSSTYVWKLSLKYKKKSIPINRFRNILIFICQILILSICAMLIAQPFILDEREVQSNEQVAIIDASASMLVGTQGETRFERAVDEVKTVAAALSGNEKITVILADDDAKVLVQYTASDNLTELQSSLDNLLLPNEDGTDNPAGCTYGSADVEGAFRLAEEVLLRNPDASVTFYTATNYINRHGVNVVDVSLDEEWNAAVLNVSTTLNDDNFYEFTVDAACYGRTMEITVYCDIYGANGSSGDGVSVQLSETMRFDSTTPEQSVTFTSKEMSSVFAGEGVYSFDHVYAYVREADSFDADNTFYLYGGKKPTLKVIYESSDPEPYISTTLLVMRETALISEHWDIDFTELYVTGDDKFILEGYDFYIFEHLMPRTLPSDGVSLLIDPQTAPRDADFQVSRYVTVPPDTPLANGVAHPITEHVDVNKITVASYIRITEQSGYDELIYQAGDPILLVKNEDVTKVAIFALDLNKSSLSVDPYLMIMMIDMFNYFIPSTISSHSFEIGDTAKITARSTYIDLTGPNINERHLEFPFDITVTRPGTYTLTQTSLTGEYLVENFFVQVPKSESNIVKSVDELPQLVYEINRNYDDLDLLVYFAAALVALLFVEWWLQSREYF